MKKIAFTIYIIIIVVIAACNNNKSSEENDISKTNIDTSKTIVDTTTVAEVSHNFNNVESRFTASIKAIVDHYLHIKNALVNNDGNDAAKGGKAMADVLPKVDKSLLTAEQKKIYDDIEDDLKENAEHIGESANKIEHQREHFILMSEDVYDLVKAFGAGQALYRDYCPMANDDKGAMWLSEMKEVKNPYFGGKMNSCVKVEEVIK